MEMAFMNWLVVTGTMEFYDVPWNSNPNWRSHIFQRGRYTTNQHLIGVVRDSDDDELSSMIKIKHLLRNVANVFSKYRMYDLRIREMIDHVLFSVLM